MQANMKIALHQIIREDMRFCIQGLLELQLNKI